jgi:hypothetical protein
VIDIGSADGIVRHVDEPQFSPWRRSPERIVFYENPRDPEVNVTLADAYGRLNKRRLVRDGRKLSYAVEPAPRKERSLRARVQFR